MKNLLHAASFLLLDLASTFVFLVLLLVTKNVPLSIVLGMVFGVDQGNTGHVCNHSIVKLAVRMIGVQRWISSAM